MEIILFVSLLATSTFAAYEQNNINNLKQNTSNDQDQHIAETNHLVTGQQQEAKKSTESKVEKHFESTTNKIISNAEQDKSTSNSGTGNTSSNNVEQGVANGNDQINLNSGQTNNTNLSQSDNVHEKIIISEEKHVTSTTEVVSTSSDTENLTTNVKHESSNTSQVISKVEKTPMKVSYEGRVFPQARFGGWSSYTTKCAIANREPKVWQRIQLLLLCEEHVQSSLPMVPRPDIPIEDIIRISDNLEDEKSFQKQMSIYPKKLPPVTGTFNEFLYRNLAVPHRTQVNVAVAPLSLRVGLAALGMAAGSFTQQEIFRVLKVNEYSLRPLYLAEIAQLNLKDLTSVQMVSKFYMDKSFFPVSGKFKKDLNRIFETDIEQADFQLAASSEVERINRVVSDKTDGHIADAVRAEDISPDTSLLFVNTVFFKGEWEIQFNKQMGFNGDFILPNKRKVEATYMTRAAEYSYYKDVKKESYRMLELPFLKTKTIGPYSMIIILPDEINGLAQVEKCLTENDSWLKGFNLHSTRHTAVVKPTIPRFTIDTRIDLRKSLGKMGVTFMFEHSPDFQGITNSTEKRQLELKELNQRVFIDVNERGTNAPPPKGPHIPGASDIKSKPIEFKANHPFAFALINRDTKTVLFMGHVVKPGFDNLFGVKTSSNTD